MKTAQPPKAYSRRNIAIKACIGMLASYAVIFASVFIVWLGWQLFYQQPVPDIPLFLSSSFLKIPGQWPTFHNELGNYEIRHPDYYQINQSSDFRNVRFIDLNEFETIKEIGLGESSNFFTVSSKDNESGLELAAWFEKHRQDYLAGQASNVISNFQKRTIRGLKAFQFYVEGENSTKHVLIAANNAIIDFAFSGGSIDLSKRIAFSFKFLQ